MTVPVLEVVGLRKTFGEHVAVHDASFALRPSASLGLVGESGSGKTTIARMLVGLERPDAGSIVVAGSTRSTRPRGKRERIARARQIQMVFQDPYLSLDRRITVRACLDEALRLHFSLTRLERRRRVDELLEQVGLGAREAAAFPPQLSGGQRQRVAIARALAVKPTVLILDEATSALDVSIQAQILGLLADIRRETGIAFLFVSHDLAVVQQVTEQLLVLYRGTIVERGESADVLATPQHPYTRLLLDSVPHPGWDPNRIAEDRRALAC
jgi:ABC-type glutathione transport system ATPase component